MQHRDNLIWIDLEMTGLRTDTDSIIEIATVVTNSQLEVLAEGPVIAIATPDTVLAAMDEWNTRQHGASGLVARIRASTETLASAEVQTLAFLRQWVPGASRRCAATVSARIAGSSRGRCRSWNVISTTAISMSAR
jgi:oligoribonuclease